MAETAYIFEIEMYAVLEISLNKSTLPVAAKTTKDHRRPRLHRLHYARYTHSLDHLPAPSLPVGNAKWKKIVPSILSHPATFASN